MMSKGGKEALETIAEKFRGEIKRIDSVISEINLKLEEINAIFSDENGYESKK